MHFISISMNKCSVMHKHAFAFLLCGHPWYHVHSFNMHMHNLKKKQNKKNLH